jgi:hypothetical protein
MKNKGLKIFFALAVAILLIFNISLNTKLKSDDTNLIQQANALGMDCVEYYFGVEMCCYHLPGNCTTGSGWLDLNGPHYNY